MPIAPIWFAKFNFGWVHSRHKLFVFMSSWNLVGNGTSSSKASITYLIKVKAFALFDLHSDRHVCTITWTTYNEWLLCWDIIWYDHSCMHSLLCLKSYRMWLWGLCWEPPRSPHVSIMLPTTCCVKFVSTCNIVTLYQLLQCPFVRVSIQILHGVPIVSKWNETETLSDLISISTAAFLLPLYPILAPISPNHSFISFILYFPFPFLHFVVFHFSISSILAPLSPFSSLSYFNHSHHHSHEQAITPTAKSRPFLRSLKIVTVIWCLVYD